jgi:hypothetical protein
VPLSKALAKSKTSPLGKEFLDPCPDEETVVVVLISDDAIIQFITDFGEEDVGRLRQFLGDSVGRVGTGVPGDCDKKFTMLEESGDTPAPHRVVLVSYEGG